jgi:HEAT repeat protein
MRARKATRRPERSHRSCFGVIALLVLTGCGTHTANIDSTDPYEQYLWLIERTSGAAADDIERVKKAASSPSALVREGAVRAIAKIDRPDLAPIVLEKLGDSEAHVRLAAIEVLRDPQAQPKILEKLRVDSAVEVRRAAAKALRAYPPNRSVYQDLIAALSDADGGVSVLAHETLTTLSGQAFARTDTKGWQEWLAKIPSQ